MSPKDVKSGRTGRIGKRAALFAALAGLLLAPAARAGPNVVVTNIQAADALTVFDVDATGLLGPPVPPSIAGGDDPYDLAFAPNRKSLYVTRHGEGTVAQYDFSSNGILTPKTPATLPAADDADDSPSGVAVSPDGKSLYVAADEVFQYDIGADGGLSAKSPAAAAAGGGGLVSIVLTPDGLHAYGANGNVIRRFDVGDGGKLTYVGHTHAGCDPQALAVTRDGKSLYAANYGGTSSKAISQFDIADDGALSSKSPSTVAAGSGASHPGVTKIALTPDGMHAYAVNSKQDSLSRYDIAADGKLTKASEQVAVGASPRFLAVSANGHRLYVTNKGSGTVSQFAIAADGSLTPRSPAEAVANPSPFGITIAPSQPPVASFTAAPAPAGSATRFDGRGSFDDDGPIIRYDWDFGDGTKLINGGPTPTHVYAKGGVYTVFLTVTDSTGASNDSVYLDAEIIRNGGPNDRASGIVPVPSLNQSVVVKPVTGTVFIKLPGSSRFVRLTSLKSIPLRTTVDTTKGQVELRASEGDRKTIDTVVFYEGVFQVNQLEVPSAAAVSGKTIVTEARLVGGDFSVCSKRRKAKGRRAEAARRKKRVRRLWGRGKGKVRTRGRKSATAVRGTKWLTVDRCDGTFTFVQSGVVAVRDFAKHKTVRVAAGSSYLARAR